MFAMSGKMNRVSDVTYAKSLKLKTIKEMYTENVDLILSTSYQLTI